MPNKNIKKLLNNIVKLISVKNDEEAAKLIVSAPRNIIFYVFNNTFTLTHFAAKFGCYKSLTLLGKAGSNLTATNNMDETPLHLAVANSHSECVDFLFAQLFPESFKNGILNAVYQNNDAYITKILQVNEASPENIPNQNKTPYRFVLLLAALRGNINIVKGIINSCDYSDISHCIKAAITNGHLSLVKEIFSSLESSKKYTAEFIKDSKLSFCMHAVARNKWDYIDWLQEDTELKILVLKNIGLELALDRSILIESFLQRYKTDSTLHGYDVFLLNRVKTDNRSDLALPALQTCHSFSIDDICLLTCKAAACNQPNLESLIPLIESAVYFEAFSQQTLGHHISYKQPQDNFLEKISILIFLFAITDRKNINTLYEITLKYKIPLDFSTLLFAAQYFENQDLCEFVTENKPSLKSSTASTPTEPPTFESILSTATTDNQSFKDPVQIGKELSKLVERSQRAHEASKKTERKKQSDLIKFDIRMSILSDIAKILINGVHKKNNTLKTLSAKLSKEETQKEEDNDIFSSHAFYIKTINHLIKSRQFKLTLACLMALRQCISNLSKHIEKSQLTDIRLYLAKIYYAAAELNETVSHLQSIEFDSKDHISSFIHCCATFALKIRMQCHNNKTTTFGENFDNVHAQADVIYDTINLTDITPENTTHQSFINLLEQFYTEYFAKIKKDNLLKNFNEALVKQHFDEMWSTSLYIYRTAITQQFYNLAWCIDRIKSFHTNNAIDLPTKTTSELQKLKRNLQLQNKFLAILELFYPLLMDCHQLSPDYEKIKSDIAFYKKQLHTNQENYELILNEKKVRKSKTTQQSATPTETLPASPKSTIDPLQQSLTSHGFVTMPITNQDDINDDDINYVVQQLQSAQKHCFLTGSRAHRIAIQTFNRASEEFCVRRSDYDIATTASLKELQQIFPRLEIVGSSFKTGLLYTNGKKIDFVPLINDLHPVDPDPIGLLLKSDLLNRIFSFNVYVHLSENTPKLVFLPESKQAIETKQINFFSHVSTREVFTKNPVAMLRAIGYSARYKFTICKAVVSLIKSNAFRVAQVNQDRLYQEVCKNFFHGYGHRSYQLLINNKILKHLFNTEKFDVKTESVLKTIDEDQRKYAQPEVFFFATLLLESKILSLQIISANQAWQLIDERSIPIRIYKSIKIELIKLLQTYFTIEAQCKAGQFNASNIENIATIKQFLEVTNPELFKLVVHAKTTAYSFNAQNSTPVIPSAQYGMPCHTYFFQPQALQQLQSHQLQPPMFTPIK